MIWSGLLIYWANDVYRIAWGDRGLFYFFPKSFYRALNLEYRLAEGMAWHFFVQWFFVANGLVWTVVAIREREWRKYRGAQLGAYLSIFLCGVGSVLTGYAIYKPAQLSWLTLLWGGYEWARFFHFWFTLTFVAFFFVHVTQVLRAGWPTLLAMIAGDPERKS
jgi:thiosulfate reductase cytochrome b subunit